MLFKSMPVIQFGVDKWLDRQNDQIAKRFTSVVRKIESLYMEDAKRQVQSAQKNVLADQSRLLAVAAVPVPI